MKKGVYLPLSVSLSPTHSFFPSLPFSLYQRPSPKGIIGGYHTVIYKTFYLHLNILLTELTDSLF